MYKPNSNDRRNWLVPPQLHPVTQYAVAVLATTCALGMALVLPYRQTNPIFAFFLLAVAVTSWAGGTRPGLFATILSLLVSIYFLMPPFLSRAVDNRGQMVRLLNVAAICVVTAFIVSWLREALRWNADLMAFPEENPSPVLRVGKNKEIIYANSVAQELLREEERQGGTCLSTLLQLAEQAWLSGREQIKDVTCSDGQIFSLYCAPVIKKGYVNIYGRNVTESRQSEQALRYQLELNQNITDKAADAIFVTDAEDRVLFLNTEAEKVFGFSRNELIGKVLHDSIHHHYPDGRLFPRSECGSVKVYSGRTIRDYEELFFRRDGTPIPVLCSTAPVEVNGKRTGAVLVAHDISDRKQKQEQLQKLHRTLNALNNASQALLRATDEAVLLQQVCSIVTRDCGYAMAWIGLAEDDAEKTVRPVAYAGNEQAYLETVLVSWADTEWGQGPTGRAIRTAQTCACRNLRTDPQLEPWKSEALKRDYASSLVVPLLAQGKAFGALTIYSRESDPFTAEEVELLEQLAADISFGIATLRTRAAHKRADEALRAATERAEAESEQLNAVLNGMTEGVIVTDPDRNVLYYNPSALQLHGFERLEEARIPVQRYLELFEFYELNGNFLPVNYWPVARLLRGETVREYKLRVRRVDKNKWFVGSFNGTAINDVNGKLKLALITVRDVTAETMAEEALRESEQRLRALANSIPNIVWSADSSGHVDFLNDWWYEYTGMTPEQSLGRRQFMMSMHPDDVWHARTVWQQAIQNATAYEVEYRFRRASDGAYRWHLGRAIPVRDTAGAVVRWFGTCTDIEDFKRAQEALVRSEKLASTGRLAATIAHEINNPLAAAMNAVYLARSDESLAPEITKLLATIDEELLRAAQITRQTLGFYRENGRREAVQVADVVESVLQLYAKRLANKGMIVKRNFRTTPAAFASTGELRQIVANLVANAIDACAKGCELHVRTAAVYKWITVTVADTGCGIAREHRARLFEPFFTTKDSLGTGLGLWVSQELVKKHGGHLRVRSRQGKGTVFAIYLPAVTEPVAIASGM